MLLNEVLGGLSGQSEGALPTLEPRIEAEISSTLLLKVTFLGVAELAVPSGQVRQATSLSSSTVSSSMVSSSRAERNLSCRPSSTPKSVHLWSLTTRGVEVNRPPAGSGEGGPLAEWN
jgi:hypothetical protein